MSSKKSPSLYVPIMAEGKEEGSERATKGNRCLLALSSVRLYSPVRGARRARLGALTAWCWRVPILLLLATLGSSRHLAKAGASGGRVWGCGGGGTGGRAARSRRRRRPPPPGGPPEGPRAENRSSDIIFQKWRPARTRT